VLHYITVGGHSAPSTDIDWFGVGALPVQTRAAAPWSSPSQDVATARDAPVDENSR
jgi:hypothetical protein